MPDLLLYAKLGLALTALGLGLYALWILRGGGTDG
jgi:hypothetical protein